MFLKGNLLCEQVELSNIANLSFSIFSGAASMYQLLRDALVSTSLDTNTWVLMGVKNYVPSTSICAIQK